VTSASATAASQTAIDFVVLKLGGEVVQSEHLAAIAADVAEMRAAGRAVVVVHGGGPQATELQKKLGQTPQIVAGRRITDAENVDLCSALIAAGAKPVGLNGTSALAIRAVKRPPRIVAGGGPDPIDFGHVGDVTGVNDALIGLLARNEYVPVIACLGADEKGNVYNINADIVANQLAIKLDARALLLVTDVPGVMRDIKDPSSRIARMTIAEGKKAIEDGVVTKGMIPKLEESFAALREGVRAVHVVGRLKRGDLSREVAEPGSVGTVLVP